LVLELRDETDEYLVGDMTERRPHALNCGQPRDEHRRLAHDGVDEELRVHVSRFSRME
jgi:hypothetical protein